MDYRLNIIVITSPRLKYLHYFNITYFTQCAPVSTIPGAIREAPHTYKLTSLPPTCDLFKIAHM
jgi:hypothetical protein